MTTTYDHRHPAYYDEADLRGELNRVFDLCHGCRMCFNLCPSFPTLFDYADKHDGDVEQMTPAEQDHVVDECYQCKICYVKCPYIPPHEWELDFPRLIMRAEAIKQQKKDGPVTERVAVKLMGKPDMLGRLASGPVAPLANKSLENSTVRKAVEKTAGIAQERLLPPYAKQRFTTWFKKRAKAALGRDRQRRAAVFPTCFVEYMEPQIGRDMVAVYERNGIECTLAGTTACCGAPMLHGGDVDGFTKQARANVAALAESVRAGKDVVVPQPTCGYVLKKDYPLYAPGPEAELVAKHTYDAAEYLMKVHRDDKAAGGDGLDADFSSGEVPPSVAYHVPCHLQAQNAGLKSRDLMKLTGTKITLVQKCSGIDGTWGYRAPNYELSRKVAAPLVEALSKASEDAPGEIVGDCHLANGAIVQETGMRPMHPLSFLARAYGITEEEDRRWGTPS